MMSEARGSAAIRFRRYWLAVWFGGLACALVLVRDPDSLWFDARLYVAATEAWLQGADPWLVTLGGNGFGAPPPTLLVLAPFAILPFGVPLLILTCFVGAAATIRVLRLPWWWVLFPPLVECVLSANIQAWLIPLLFLRAGPLAVLAKIYAAAPLVLLGRWRQLAVTGALLALTLPILPWATFVADLPVIAGYFRDQTPYALPTDLLLLLLPFALLALAVIGRWNAAWMVVPALAAQQWYYTTLAMPTRSSIVAFLVCVPIPGSGLLALFGLAGAELLRRRIGPGRWRGQGLEGPPRPTQAGQ